MTADWELRFLATTTSLPQTARFAPKRAIFRSNASGVFEFYAWDRDSGAYRQITNRKNGTAEGVISDDGAFFWWFDDTDGDEFGSWRRQPFSDDHSGAELALTGVPAGYSAGLALGPTKVAVGVSGPAAAPEETQIYLATPGENARLLYRHHQDAGVGDISHDESLIAISHSEHGDSLHPNVRIMRTSDGATVVELADGPGKALHPIAFSPLAGDNRLLVSHERHGRPELLIVDAATAVTTELTIDIPGELDGSWYPDARALLVVAVHAGRTTMHRYDFASGGLAALATPPGVVMAAAAVGDQVEYLWSDAEVPPTLRSTAGEFPLHPPGITAPASNPVRDFWVPGPGGDIHVLVSAANGPTKATIFSIHGGPHHADEDSFDPWRAAYLDNGYQVVQVNYRGSTGYGSSWRDALIGNPGLTELADIAAVQDWALANGMVTSGRSVLSGYSWGGYLTLLGLGVQPQRWLAGIAGVPVADYHAAYEDEMEPLRAMDRVLFGGTPAEKPQTWRRANPLEYVAQVQAPLLVLAGANDPRCPIRQVDNYLARLTELEKPHRVYRFDAGHGSLVTKQRIEMVAAELDFLNTLPPAPQA